MKPVPQHDRRHISFETAAMELRAVEGGLGELAFRPIVFESVSRDLGGFYEVIGRSAIEPAITGRDVRAVYNHESGALLGRTSSGTLALEVDDKGVFFRCALPGTSAGRDVAELWARRDLTGGSFQFVGGEWAIEGEHLGLPLYRLVRVDAIPEMGPVTFPAYGGTELSARALSLAGAGPGVRSPAPAPARRALGDLEQWSFQARLQKAVGALLREPPYELYWDWSLHAIYEAFVIIKDWLSGTYWRVEYQVSGVEITLGTPVAVVARWEPEPAASAAADPDTERRLRHQRLLVPGILPKTRRGTP